MQDLSTSLPPWLVGCLVFGGINPISKVVVLESAFDFAFSKERNFEEGGCTPLTWACLQNHNQVCWEMGDTKDATNNTMQLIQSTNGLSTFFLKEHGFNSDVLKASIKKVKRQFVTVRHSQEQIHEISQATTHGNLYHATGGGHSTDEDVFSALQKKKVEAEIKQLKKKKDVAFRMSDVNA